LDFVVCLPAVHKNTIAIAAGELEVRNAINESSQKLLARRLKGEAWIDPRSMKLIERTVVPVIKVSTKDSKARALQLDITFDAPGHHGREAVVMVTQIADELPMIRPITIVLKKFLLDRGLLTAYTGGLSSYCLFLMVARYLQEQPSSWGDCGALLMGFLDFYGNHVSYCLIASLFLHICETNRSSFYKFSSLIQEQPGSVFVIVSILKDPTTLHQETILLDKQCGTPLHIPDHPCSAWGTHHFGGTVLATEAASTGQGHLEQCSLLATFRRQMPLPKFSIHHIKMLRIRVPSITECHILLIRCL
jgi:hypothetical protein